jgi:hypothetical protein
VAVKKRLQHSNDSDNKDSSGESEVEETEEEVSSKELMNQHDSSEKLMRASGSYGGDTSLT